MSTPPPASASRNPALEVSTCGGGACSTSCARRSSGAGSLLRVGVSALSFAGFDPASCHVSAGGEDDRSPSPRSRGATVGSGDTSEQLSTGADPHAVKLKLASSANIPVISCVIPYRSLVY